MLRLIAPPATVSERPVICSVNSEAPDAIAVPSVATVELNVLLTTSNEPTVVLNSEPSVTWMLEPDTSTRSSAVVVSPVHRRERPVVDLLPDRTRVVVEAQVAAIRMQRTGGQRQPERIAVRADPRRRT